MAALGVLGIPWPEELGGSGMDYLSYIMVIHELAKVDASHAITVSAHTTLGTSPIVDFGTAEQKQRYVSLLAAGKVLGGFGLTEPGAGSDAGGTTTVAVEKGDHYVLNGSKIFITHAGVGEIFVVTARTDPAAKKTRGITAFIVTKDTTDLEEARRVGVGHDPSLPKCRGVMRSEEHTSELQSRLHLVCRLLLEKKKTTQPHVRLRSSGTSTTTATDTERTTGHD